jgi:hypothetical protein
MTSEKSVQTNVYTVVRARWIRREERRRESTPVRERRRRHGAPRWQKLPARNRPLTARRQIIRSTDRGVGAAGPVHLAAPVTSFIATDRSGRQYAYPQAHQADPSTCIVAVLPYPGTDLRTDERRQALPDFIRQ